MRPGTFAPMAMTRLDSGMICTCGEDGKAAGDALIARVKSLLEAGGENFGPHPIDDHEFCTEVLRSLSTDFEVDLTGAYADMWFLVSTERFDKDFDTAVQADTFEHGLAATWLLYAEALGDPRVAA